MPPIIDSMGWIAFRKGRLQEAEEFLRRAWKIDRNPEIAAHLGEVLWKLGRKEEATRVWKSALSDNPDHETLLAVMQKFNP